MGLGGVEAVSTLLDSLAQGPSGTININSKSIGFRRIYSFELLYGPLSVCENIICLKREYY